uniref:DUF2214 domain-containing protein n=1 Tax=Paulinella micropora TaxID=1928728 RepID=A0A385HZ94_9EUKA|nr:hypothetical protein PMNZ_011 [Paulinella micropora]AXY62977.1 hypothetical protein PMNZ_011 [Paulinella micropora]
MLKLDAITWGLIGNATISYIHYLGVMICLSSLVLQRKLIQTSLSKYDFSLIIVSDIAYGIASLLVLISGILKVLYFGKTSIFYIENPLFWWKIGIYLAIGGLSLYPTVTYVLWIIPLLRGNIPNVNQQVISRLSLILNTEIFAFIIVPLLAALMTRGIGL